MNDIHDIALPISLKTNYSPLILIFLLIIISIILILILIKKNRAEPNNIEEIIYKKHPAKLIDSTKEELLKLKKRNWLQTNKKLFIKTISEIINKYLAKKYKTSFINLTLTEKKEIIKNTENLDYKNHLNQLLDDLHNICYSPYYQKNIEKLTEILDSAFILLKLDD